MRVYTVHTKPDHEPVLVREGWSFWALLFQPFWALYHGMWLTAFVLMVINGLLGAALEHNVLAPGSVVACNLAVMVLLALFGHDLHRRSLARRGYALTDIVSGGNETMAMQRYFDRACA